MKKIVRSIFERIQNGEKITIREMEINTSEYDVISLKYLDQIIQELINRKDDVTLGESLETLSLIEWWLWSWSFDIQRSTYEQARKVLRDVLDSRSKTLDQATAVNDQMAFDYAMKIVDEGFSPLKSQHIGRNMTWWFMTLCQGARI